MFQRIRAFFSAKNLSYMFSYEREHVAPALEKFIESEFYTGAGIAVAIGLKMATDGAFNHPPAITPHDWFAANLQTFLMAQYIIPFGRAAQGWLQSKQSAKKD